MKTKTCNWNFSKIIVLACLENIPLDDHWLEVYHYNLQLVSDCSSLYTLKHVHDIIFKQLHVHSLLALFWGLGTR